VVLVTLAIIGQSSAASAHGGGIDAFGGHNNLAFLYFNQGQYAAAEPLYKRALSIYEKALGPDHPSVATFLNNLAALYRATGQILEAQELEKRLSDKNQR